MNQLVKYLWNKGWRTRISIFGTFAAFFVTLAAGWPILSVVMLLYCLAFTLLETQFVIAKYFEKVMEENGLDTSIYDENLDKFFEEIN